MDTHKRTKDGLFRIEYARRDSDSYMHSYTSESWDVISTETGESYRRFSGRWDADAGGDDQSGATSVEFEGEHGVLVTNHDGTFERVELPISFKLSEDERALIATFVDGREERTSLVFREDNAVARRIEARRLARIKQHLAKVQR